LKRIGDDPDRLDAKSLRELVLEKSQQCCLDAAKTCTTALPYVPSLSNRGRQVFSRPVRSVPVLAHWRLSSLPRYLQPEEVERIISSCDPHSPVGRRDRAILLLARLGLRAGGIVKLRLDDIDWEAAVIRVSGKGRREVRLPLAQEVGWALVGYLPRRPASNPH